MATRRYSSHFVPVAFFLVSAGLYVSYLPRFPTEWDSVQLVMGLDDFDVTQHTPHPPGYWLYVAAGRAVRAVTPLDGHDSMALLAALAAAGTVAITFAVGRSLANHWLGAAAAAFLMTSPFLWFYGSSVASYAFDGLAAAVLMLLACRSSAGSWHGIAAAATLGLGAGFRQSSLILLAPLALMAVLKSTRSWRGWLLAGTAGLTGLAVWAVPMVVEQPGGLGAYREATREQFVGTVRQTSVFYGATARQAVDNLSQASGYSLAAVAVLLPVFLAGSLASLLQNRRHGSPRQLLAPPALLLIALIPPLAFVLAVSFGKAGYVISFLPAAGLLLLWPAANLRGTALILAGVLVAMACALNAQRFLFGQGVLPLGVLNEGPWFTKERIGAPYRVSAHTLRAVDNDTTAYLAMADELDPRRDVLVYVLQNGGHRYRHAMFTLPSFTTYLVRQGAVETLGRGGRRRLVHGSTIETAAGGRAVFVLDQPSPEVLDLVRQGKAKPLHLRTGPTVWHLGPGTRAFGLAVVSPPGDGAHVDRSAP